LAEISIIMVTCQKYKTRLFWDVSRDIGEL